MAGLNACDVTGEQNYDFEQGNTLAIVGPAELAIPDDGSSIEGSYYSKAFTIDKDYAWSVDGGSTENTVRRDGEYIDVTFMGAGTYTISVNDGEYEGTLEVTVE
jgi:hypothetical protein